MRIIFYHGRFPRRAIWPTVLLWMVVPTLMVQQSDQGLAADNPFAAQYIKHLEEGGVQVTRDGLSVFLKRHHPSNRNDDELLAVVKQLGDDDFFKREAAMLELQRKSVSLRGVLEKAASGDDPEVRWRAKLILDQGNQPVSDLLYSAFVVIHNRKIPGLASDVLKTASSCESDLQRTALGRALEATATKDDLPLLRESLKDDLSVVRLVAATVMWRLVGEESKTDLIPLLKDRDDSVRLSVAELLATTVPREVLPTLGSLLDSEKSSVRSRSIQLLHTHIKSDVTYSAYAGPQERSRQAAAWRDVIAEHLKER